MDNEQATSTPKTSRTDAGPRFFYSNSLRLYHASANIQSGAAVDFQLNPARRWTDGNIFLTLVPQKEELQARPGSARKVASFDWKGRKICVKLNFQDVCGILSVLRGEAAEVGEGRGLLHDSKDATTVIYFSQVKDRPGTFSLCLSRKAKSGGDPFRLRFGLSAAEGLGIRLLLEQSLFPMTFGFPSEGTGAFRPDAQDTATAVVDGNDGSNGIADVPMDGEPPF